MLYVRQLDRIPGAVAYYPPLGTLDIADDVRTLMREAQAEGRRLHLVGLSPKEKEQLEADLPGAFEFSSDRNFADYLYLTKTIAAYEGPGLAIEGAPRDEQVLPAVRQRGVLRAHRPRPYGRAARLPAGLVRDEPPYAAPTSTLSSWSIERSCST